MQKGQACFPPTFSLAVLLHIKLAALGIADQPPKEERKLGVTLPRVRVSLHGVRPHYLAQDPQQTAPGPTLLPINVVINRTKLAQLLEPIGQCQAPSWGLGLLNVTS